MVVHQVCGISGRNVTGALVEQNITAILNHLPFNDNNVMKRSSKRAKLEYVFGGGDGREDMAPFW